MDVPDNKDDCAKWLRERGITTTGTLTELQMRIRKFNLYPSLSEKLKKKNEKNYSFETSLDPLTIPPPSAAWNSNETQYPTVTETMFKTFASKQREASLGQQDKAYKMLASRKITSVKIIKVDRYNTFVKGYVKISYGVQSHRAVVLFCSLVPSKAYCQCAIGVSGLCCHVQAVLLFLKHYTNTKEKILELTCTQQIQKWHKRPKKGMSVPMLPLRELKLTSAKSEKALIKSAKMVSSPNNIDQSRGKHKRDILKMKMEIDEKINKMNISFEHHCLTVMRNSEAGKNTSLLSHLSYKHSAKAAGFLADHDYCIKNLSFDSEIIYSSWEVGND